MPNQFIKVAWRITLLYVAVATLWICFSDEAVHRLVTDPQLAMRLEIFKGLAFVVVTALLLFWALARQLQRIQNEADARQRAEIEVKTNEAKFHSYVENAPVAVFVVNRQGRLVEVNPAASRLLDCGAKDLLQKPLADIVTRGERERAAREFAGLVETGRLETEYTLQKTDKSPVTVSLHAVKLQDDRFIGFAQDISSLKQHEESLRQSREEMQYIIENIQDVVFQIDLAGNYTFGNAAAERLTGYPLAELLQMSMWQLVLPEYHAMLRERLQRRIAGELQEKTFEFEILHRAGQRLWLELTTSGLTDHHGKLTAIQGVARDVTERKRAEAELRKLSRAVECSPASIVITSSAGNIEYVNRKFVEISGYTAGEVHGKNPRLLKSGEMPRGTYRQLWQTITAGREWRGEFHNRKKNGELYWEAASISPILDNAGRITHFLAVKEDITRQRNLEAQLRQSQKMEAVGRLAGGVAHDFNNIITVVQGYASLLLAGGNLSAGTRQPVMEIQAAAERASNLTRQLLAFSRRQPLQPRDLNLNEIVASASKMLQRLLGEDVSLHVQYAPQDVVVRADAGMLDQILLNLAVNARDAMPKGGQLIIETTTGNWESFVSEPADSAYVCLRVRDTGCGIPADILPRIFEPFFTTKDAGKGSGLGLATVYGIVQQHQGWIDVDSEVGKGTTFSVYLPRLAHAATRSDQPETETLSRGRETVLLAEDDAALRDLVRGALTRLGYRILEAENGAAAVQLWQKHRHEIDLLLTDVVMPGGMTGAELAQRLLLDKPELPVIYTSGYAPEIADGKIQMEEGVNYLPKPFDTGKLAHAIRARLENSAAKNP